MKKLPPINTGLQSAGIDKGLEHGADRLIALYKAATRVEASMSLWQYQAVWLSVHMQVKVQLRGGPTTTCETLL